MIGAPMTRTDAACPLCTETDDALLWRDAVARVVLVAEPAHPGYCRVILARHAREMTDLDPAESARLLQVVLATERAVRAVVRPDKVNLASLGNLVPHVHWHVIPRWRDDRCFPEPIWAPPRREVHGAAWQVPPAEFAAGLRERLHAQLD